MTITGISVQSEFRYNIIKAIQDNKPELIEGVWESITKNMIKDSKFKWNGTWEDGKDRSKEMGNTQYLLRICLNCGSRAGLHISKRCPNII